MTWASSHQESEGFSAAAHKALREGDISRSSRFFAQAAEAEARALEAVPADKPRTLGITAVSAAALWYKARNLNKAEALAHRACALTGMPAFALDQLRELLQVIWNERAQHAAGISFLPGQVIVSVKGGEVVAGGAPLDLILSKVQTVQNIFYRTAEFLKDLPLRRKGPPQKELQERCRPWLFQSVPGSYQFAVAIQKPAQTELFDTGEPEPKTLTDTFLAILRATGEDPAEGLKNVVAKEDYRLTFMRMARNLAPTGKTFQTMEIRGPGETNPIVLSPSSRRLISDTLRETRKPKRDPDIEPESVLRGTLRALHLDKDWLEVSVNGLHHRVHGVGEAVDDVIGPMVNHEVVVRVRITKGSRLKFIDIEQEE